MDVAPFTELQDFIDCLDVEDKKVETESIRREDKGKTLLMLRTIGHVV